MQQIIVIFQPKTFHAVNNIAKWHIVEITLKYVSYAT